MVIGRASLWQGVIYALLAGLMWGIVFVAPAMLPEYHPAALAFGRYIAFGVVALLLAMPDRRRLGLLTRHDWMQAFKLALVGNIVYYLFLSASIQAGGVPLASVLIGTLPVVIAVCANWRQRSLPWARLAPSLALMAMGIALVNQSELRRLGEGGGSAYALGAALAMVAVAAWTWYPIQNAHWLQQNTQLSATTWTTAQGVATLPLALFGWLVVGAVQGLLHPERGYVMTLGPRPLAYGGLMLAMGLFASWAGTLAWSRASRLLPTALTGQLIVFETLSALAYGYVHRGAWPDLAAGSGILLLVVGVLVGVRAFHRPRFEKTDSV